MDPADAAVGAHASALAAADLIDSVSVRVVAAETVGPQGKPTPASSSSSPFSLFGGPKQHTVYVVRVTVGLREWDVRRRYSAFRQLLAAVAEKMGQGTVDRLLPPFPLRTVLTSAMDPSVVQERRTALDAWLAGLVRLPAAWSVGTLARFLDDGSGVLKMQTELLVSLLSRTRPPKLHMIRVACPPDFCVPFVAPASSVNSHT